jgi:pimeloyl-ACP methyl ester carboxylesterase
VSIVARYTAFLAAHPPRWVRIDGASWELIEAGSGPPVLLLPGGFGVAATSFAYIAELARDYRVLALSYPPQLPRIAQLADGVAALLDLCGIAQVCVVGGSASGAVAQALVRRHPERVAVLVLAQTGPPAPRRAALAEACAQLCYALPATLTLALLRGAIWGFLPGGGETERFWRDHFAAVLARSGRADLAARFRALADYDRNYRFAAGDLANWAGRVALIEAERDGLLSVAERAALGELYPQATLHRIQGGRHAHSITEPEPQLAALRAALQFGIVLM